MFLLTYYALIIIVIDISFKIRPIFLKWYRPKKLAITAKNQLNRKEIYKAHNSSLLYCTYDM